MKYQPTLNEGRPHTAPVSPSRHAYGYYRCRCDACRAIQRTYKNWGCRCIPCAEAASIENARRAGTRKYAEAES